MSIQSNSQLLFNEARTNVANHDDESSGFAVPTLMNVFLSQMAHATFPGIGEYVASLATTHWGPTPDDQLNHQLVINLRDFYRRVYFAFDFTFDDCGVVHFDDNNAVNMAILTRVIQTDPTVNHPALNHWVNTVAEIDDLEFPVIWATIVGSIAHEVVITQGMFN